VDKLPLCVPHSRRHVSRVTAWQSVNP
jgi:hypothetical protein